LHLKSHYSIEGPVPNLREYRFTASTAYVFNLPEEITERELMLEMGQNLVESVKVHYCLLGLPAYAVVQFISEDGLNERFSRASLDIDFKGKVMKVVTPSNRHKCPLHRRQLAIKGLPEGETPASMVEKLSAYGRVVGLSLPMDIYKEQSLNEIK
jgi:hypothetical protein